MRIAFLIFKYGLLLSCLKFTERVYCLCACIAVNNVHICIYVGVRSESIITETENT